MAEAGQDNPILVIPEPFDAPSDSTDSVILVVEDCKLHVSKGTLGSQSPVLYKTFFNEGFREAREGICTLADKKLEDVLAFLYWLYKIPNPAAPTPPSCGCYVVGHCGIEVPIKGLVGLLRLADFWEVDALKDHCRVVYRRFLPTITNVEEGRNALAPLEALKLEDTEFKSALDTIFRSSGIPKEDILAVSAGYSTDFYVHFLKLLLERSRLMLEAICVCFGCGKSFGFMGSCQHRHAPSHTDEDPILTIPTPPSQPSPVPDKVPEPFDKLSDFSESVVLIVASCELHVSKNVLVGDNRVLCKKFAIDGGEAREGRLTLDNMKLVDVLAFLFWRSGIRNPTAPMGSYCGCGVVDHCGVDIPMESMVGLLHIAKEWEVGGLKDHCRAVYRHYLRTITSEAEERRALAPLEVLMLEETELKSVLDTIFRSSSGISKEDISAVSAGYSADFYVKFLELLLERSTLMFKEWNLCFGCGKQSVMCRCRQGGPSSDNDESPSSDSE